MKIWILEFFEEEKKELKTPLICHLRKKVKELDQNDESTVKLYQ